MNQPKNKGGRPPLVPGERRYKTSVSLTREQQIAFRRIGGSRWLQQTIERMVKAKHAS